MSTNSIQKKRAFIFVFFFLIILVLITFELILRFIGYGFSTEIFVKPKYIDEIYVENLSFSNKYNLKQNWISSNINNMLIRNVFPAKKKQNTLRGFVLGGSSAQGFPYESNQSFSKITEIALKQSKKYDSVEVINLGLSAMSSYFVKDTAKKVLDYQPDFIVIYAGHNEYYGTISYTTGGNYYTKNLNLLLKESKIFQMIFSFIGSGRVDSGSQRGNLMSEQFRNTKIFKNEAIDKKVAEDFIRNLDEIVKKYTAKNIPVIVVEPVSNLYDMPPFMGENDEEFKQFIEQYYQVVSKKDKNEIQDFYNVRLSHKEYDKNANIRYLDALSQMILQDNPSIDSFIEAKDLDAIPFRARSELIKALRQYCDAKSKEYSGLYFIPFLDVLVKNYGEKILSNEIFADHLHFNQKGQRILSKVIAQKITEIFNFNEDQRNKTNDFYNDDQGIDNAIFYLPAYRVAVSSELQSLVEYPPYSDMLIKYKLDKNNVYTPETELDRGMQKIMEDMIAKYHRQQVNSLLIADHYIKNNDMITARDYINSGMFMFPGTALTYLATARYYSMAEPSFEKAKGGYINAYLLSEKDATIYNDMKQYFLRENHPEILDELDKKYGPPKKVD